MYGGTLGHGADRVAHAFTIRKHLVLDAVAVGKQLVLKACVAVEQFLVAVHDVVATGSELLDLRVVVLLQAHDVTIEIGVDVGQLVARLGQFLHHFVGLCQTPVGRAHELVVDVDHQNDAKQEQCTKNDKKFKFHDN